jgi:glycerol transport system permease protein
VLIVTAGYLAMRPEPIEAALIDRASRWAIFRHIEIPALRFPILMAMMLRIIDSLKVFEEPYIMFGVGPYQCVEFISTNMLAGMLGMRFSHTAAVGLFVSWLTIVIFYVYSMFMTKGKGLK